MIVKMATGIETSSEAIASRRASSLVRNDWIWMLAGLLLFALFNIITAPYSPKPWLDEVSYTDPGASLALDGTFTSTLWAGRGTPIWTGNVPLHELALAGAFKMFGFSCRVCRSVDVVYYSITVALIFVMVRQYSLIRTAQLRWLFYWILLTGTGLTALYRDARYDAIGCLLFTLWLLSALQSRQRPWWFLAVGLTAALMPAASLMLLPYLCLTGVTSFILWRWKIVPVMIVSGLGVVAGLVIMFVIYRYLGVPDIFSAVMQSAGHTFFDLVFGTLYNLSYLAALAAGMVAWIGWQGKMRWSNGQVRLAMTLLALGLVTPAILFVAGKYEFYYSWTAIFPASLGAIMMLEQPEVAKLAQRIAVLLMLVASFTGLPRHCLQISVNWERNEPQAIATFARLNASPSDVVFVDHNRDALPVYYSLRAHVKYSYWVAPPLIPADANKITVAFVSTSGLAGYLHDELGGNWRETSSEEFGAKTLLTPFDHPFRLTAYRRL